MRYIISARNLGRLMRKAGLHVRETLEMTDGKVTLCRDCGYLGKDADGDIIYRYTGECTHDCGTCGGSACK